MPISWEQALDLAAEQLLRIIFGAAPLSQSLPQSLKGAVFADAGVLFGVDAPAGCPACVIIGANDTAIRTSVGGSIRSRTRASAPP